MKTLDMLYTKSYNTKKLLLRIQACGGPRHCAHCRNRRDFSLWRIVEITIVSGFDGNKTQSIAAQNNVLPTLCKEWVTKMIGKSKQPTKKLS